MKSNNLWLGLLSGGICACFVAGFGAAALAYGVSAEPAVAPLTSLHSAYMNLIPQENPFVPRRGEMPELHGMSEARWELLKEQARFSRVAPYNPNPVPSWYDPSDVFTPGLRASFAGLSNSASTCPYFGGCAPPDMAIAASPAFVVQAVNTSVAVYDTTGHIKAGFPKDFTHFFGVPPPLPAGCDSAGPFTSDPRAFYDQSTGRFWVIALQVEDPALIGTPCTIATKFWAAVSKTSDPTGGWNVYSFDMEAGASPAVIADFTQTGLDAKAFYFGGNMYDASALFYSYDEIFAADKSKMEAGMPVTAHGLKKIKVGGVLMDTIQPVLVQGASPKAGLFIDTFDINSGGGVCSGGCKGLNVYAMTGALTTHPALNEMGVTTLTYVLPPSADQPGSPGSLDTNDPRISATPIYSGGVIAWAQDTGVSNGTMTVPGVHWGEVKVTLDAAGAITGLNSVDSIMSFTGDRAAFFGSPMMDKAGDLLMVFDSTSSTIFPGEYYASRLVTDPPGTLEAPKTLKKGVAVNTFSARWGDYEATSYDGPAGDNIWFASQYSNSGGTWSTFIGKTRV